MPEDRSTKSILGEARDAAVMLLRDFRQLVRLAGWPDAEKFEPSTGWTVWPRWSP